MPFHLRPLTDQNRRAASPLTRHHHTPEYDVDTDTSSDTEGVSIHPRSAFLSPSFNSNSLTHPNYNLPSSLPTTAANSPLPSRSSSPLPTTPRSFTSSGESSPCGSDTDEPGSPLLRHRGARPRWWSDDKTSWWKLSHRIRRRWKRYTRCLTPWQRFCKSIVRFPYFPTQAATIMIALLLFSVFALLVTLIIIHILNPDKEPLPWREYCSTPPPRIQPPSLSLSPPGLVLDPSLPPPTFPPADLEDHSPVGIYLGVFSTDQAVQRRMLIRSTWAQHPHSRNGAGVGDDGRGTARTIVRFILGKPRSSWERRVQLEMETYNDMVILPIHENMNLGKTHSFFTWAASNAWVPPPHASDVPYPITYANMTAMPPPLAIHDPRLPQSSKPWVRPDFVVKADDDTFTMLSELEARLRVAMHDATHPKKPAKTDILPQDTGADLITSKIPNPRVPFPLQDPLIYQGYLVKNRFMAGELYSMSWGLVDWIAADPVVKGMIKGAEDQQVAKWMHKHPKASEVRWVSDHCWIYDHPRAGTVYSHGFLFPSEVARVRQAYKSYVQSIMSFSPSAESATPPDSPSIRQRLSYSTVSNFGTRYSPPVFNLTPLQSIEALVEGSAMSRLRDNIVIDSAWKQREGRKQRYDGQRVGGTIVVHSIKKHEWYLETALALLEGAEVVEEERRRPGFNDASSSLGQPIETTATSDLPSEASARVDVGLHLHH